MFRTVDPAITNMTQCIHDLEGTYPIVFSNARYVNNFTSATATTTAATTSFVAFTVIKIFVAFIASQGFDIRL